MHRWLEIVSRSLPVQRESKVEGGKYLMDDTKELADDFKNHPKMKALPAEAILNEGAAAKDKVLRIVDGLENVGLAFSPTSARDSMYEACAELKAAMQWITSRGTGRDCGLSGWSADGR